MSRPIKIQWLAHDASAVCLSQTIAAAGSLEINGGLVKREGPFAYAEFTSLERTVSLTSAGNLAGVNFTITGTRRGAVVSEVISGPNATTKYTVGLFTTVTSVTVNAALLSAVTIGSGTTGNTIWVRSDYNRSVNSATIGIEVLAGNITYTFETCLEDPFASDTPWVFSPIDGVTILTVPTATPMLNATVSTLANYAWPTHSSRVRVSASNATGTLDFNFLEQGID